MRTSSEMEFHKMVAIIAQSAKKMTLLGAGWWSRGRVGWGYQVGKQLCGLERADKEPTNCSQSGRARRRPRHSTCNRYKRFDDRPYDVRISKSIHRLSTPNTAHRLSNIHRDGRGQTDHDKGCIETTISVENWTCWHEQCEQC